MLNALVSVAYTIRYIQSNFETISLIDKSIASLSDSLHITKDRRRAKSVCPKLGVRKGKGNHNSRTIGKE